MAKGVYVGVNGIAQKVKKMYVGIGPVTYTELEYIESSGTQYIDTGVIGKSGLKANGKLMINDVTGTICFFGSRKSSSYRCYLLSYSNGNLVYAYNNIVSSSLAVQLNKVYEFATDLSVGSQSLTVDGEVVASGTDTTEFTTGQNILLFGGSNGGTATWFSSLRLYSLSIYDGDNLVRDYVPCQSSNGAIGLYDKVEGKFYANAGSGTFTAGTAGEVIKTTGIARKVKKGYIGVGGVARPFLSYKEVAYYGAITSLNGARHAHSSASVGGYALFGGGLDGSGNRKTEVVAYNSTLTKQTITSLATYNRTYINTASSENYALWAGGHLNTTSPSNAVEAYNKSLTRSTATSLTYAREGMGTAVINGISLFLGGERNDNSTLECYQGLDAYDSALTKTFTAVAISDMKCELAGASNSKYAIFGGGLDSYNSVNKASVDAFDSSLTRTKCENLSNARKLLAAASAGKYVYFVGGSPATTTVDVYDESLTHITLAGGITTSRYDMGYVSHKNIAFFAGGYNGGVKNIVDTFDENLTHVMAPNLQVARDSGYYNNMAATGDYVLIAGGYTENGATSSVEAYLISE